MTTADGSVLGITQIFGTAPRKFRFNLVMLGDGFTQAQQTNFDNACASFVNVFIATAPFSDVRRAINVFRVNVASTDSGADDPVAAGGTGATARTYFDSTFGNEGIRRYLLCNASTALQVAAAQVPQFSAVLVLVNSSIPGGGGGSVGTFSLAGGVNTLSETAMHELGHSAFDLADEYAYLAGLSTNEPAQNDYTSVEPSQPNVTINTKRDTLKWAWAVDPTTPIPTMRNNNCGQVDNRPSPVPDGTVGLFEGAKHYHCGIFRPEYRCRMQTLGVPFCRICSASIRHHFPPSAAECQQLRARLVEIDDMLETLEETLDGQIESGDLRGARETRRHMSQLRTERGSINKRLEACGIL